jgi:hypothetical protein
VLHLPVPKILSFSPDHRNSVEAEYIIGELPTGVPVAAVWKDWRRKDMVDFAEDLMDLERKMSSVSFAGHGCIYLKKHLEQRRVRAHELGLVLENRDSDLAGDVDHQAAELYALGPVVDSFFWDAERSAMNLSRGPWKTPLEYLKALGTNELQWAKSALPRAGNAGLTRPEPMSYTQLLSKYLQLIPHLCPQSSRPLLSHANLSALNVFVDPETRKISCITNWQSAQVVPPLFQSSIPPLFHDAPGASARHVGFAAQTYMQLREMRYPAWHQVLMNPPDREAIIKLAEIVPGAWTHRTDKLLGVMLLNLANQWEGIVRMRRSEFEAVNSEKLNQAVPACPIAFSDVDAEHLGEYVARYDHLVETLDDYGLPHPLTDGMVPAEDFETAAKANAKAKTQFLKGADGTERDLLDKFWPYPVSDSALNAEESSVEAEQVSWWKVW